MLTNIFYYNFYKPYILKINESGKQPAKPKQEKIADKRQSAERFKVLLNKSMKPEVVGYARGISSSIVGMKESAKYLVRDMTDFNKNMHRRGMDTAKRWIQCDLEDFVALYNISTEFLSDQIHSQALRGFSSRLEENVSMNLERLAGLGIIRAQDGKLNFNSETFNKLDEGRLNMAIGETLSTFKDIYSDSGEILGEPLKEHMNFRGLGYYYNYKLGMIENDTFKMIESGMLIDKAV